ncbi:transglycosylase-like protein with SLT domain [Nocardiopsis sp. Huas11]|uniref:transglycosylase family protein n=1 Tax=Nocardiopsis sp. Huas11 TaxID=2183912 RepID=UPI000F10A626|nr:transglycosylase-like protein with SLT domain [Nocardiopsis sp. Huas11]
MSLRSTAAVAAATLVAGATFAVSAFAEERVDPDVAASAAVEETAPDAATDEEFFAASEQLTEDELADLRAASAGERDTALGEAGRTAQVEATAIEPEEEEPEEEETEEDTGTPPVGGGDAAGLNWAGLAQCESGGDPTAVNSAGGYYGLYQFSTTTWESVGGTGLPSEASPDEQTQRAQQLYNAVGGNWQSQWPHCGVHLFD